MTPESMLEIMKDLCVTLRMEVCKLLKNCVVECSVLNMIHFIYTSVLYCPFYFILVQLSLNQV